MSKNISLTKETIDHIFETKENTQDATIALYEVAIPDYHKIDKVNSFPKISETTNKYIFRKMIDMDIKNKVKHMNGGLWMNSGFSYDDSMPDWEVFYDN